MYTSTYIYIYIYYSSPGVEKWLTEKLKTRIKQILLISYSSELNFKHNPFSNESNSYHHNFKLISHFFSSLVPLLTLPLIPKKKKKKSILLSCSFLKISSMHGSIYRIYSRSELMPRMIILHARIS